MTEHTFIPIIKLITIGDSHVGKTCLINRYVDDMFNNTSVPTIGVEFKLKEVNIQDVDYKVQIWDTAGQERFRSICETYYRGADGAVIVFDITNKQSFENVSYWIENFKLYRDVLNDNVVIIGNKSDLTSERKVSPETITEFADSKNLKYFEVSAKNGENVNEVFQYIEEIIHNGKQSSITIRTKDPKGFDVNSNNSDKKGCC